MKKLYVLTVLISLCLSAVLTNLAVTAIFADEQNNPGSLVASYALENGAAVVVTHLGLSAGDQLVVIYYDPTNRWFELRRIGLDGASLGAIEIEHCGGRIHLTYERNDVVEHVAVDVPETHLGYLPVVCKDK